MMEEKKIRIDLCEKEPYLIETKLLPKMYFREDDKNTEYWIFFYRYIRGLSDLTIGVRLGYDFKTIYNKTLKIIKNNYTIITNFLQNSYM